MDCAGYRLADAVEGRCQVTPRDRLLPEDLEQPDYYEIANRQANDADNANDEAWVEERE